MPKPQGAEARGHGTIKSPAGGSAQDHRDRRLERLISRLPARLRDMVTKLRDPSQRWQRLAVSLLLMLGGLLAFLPILGLWMLPLGLLLLIEDVPALRRTLDAILDWIEKHHPEWIYGKNQ
ncbi:hypothetical protein [Beijerinckia mobilis]|uniref:hypothetical protein n=1 Tax=Beijerinckia mobilis TaxID=231434 RepID=UPI000ACF7E9C|nr:hypothetical protein [Beijerinckia mobilis]